MTTTQKLSTLHIACGGNGCGSCDNGRVLTAISVKANNPTDKQIAFYVKLAREAIEITAQICELSGTPLADDVRATLVSAYQDKLDSVKSKSEMSAQIDDMIQSQGVHRQTLRNEQAKAGQAERQARSCERAKGERNADDVDGIYQLDGGRIVKVQYAVHGSGKPYAKLLTQDPEGSDDEGRWTWEYAPGLVRECTPERKMTLEQAKAFGALYGVCCNCARTLTDEHSIEAGIGPICAKRFA